MASPALFCVLLLLAAAWVTDSALVAERRNISFVHCPPIGVAASAAPGPPCPAAVPGAVEWVTPALVSRATLSFGQPWAFSSAASRLAAGKCLTVAALGGSVTLGHSFGNRRADEPGAWRDTGGGYHHPDAPRSHVQGDESEATARAEAYPRYLKEELDAAWPCPSPGHTVHNLGRARPRAGGGAPPRAAARCLRHRDVRRIVYIASLTLAPHPPCPPPRTLYI